MIQEIMKKNQCDELHIKYDSESGCTFLIALNTSYNHKCNGGIRMMQYPTLKEAIEDVTKLAGAMTKKCIVIGRDKNMGFSGGKAVIIGDPKKQKTARMFKRFGQFIQSFNGKFQAGRDLNISVKDLGLIAKGTEYVDGLETGLGDGGIPTAHGVFIAMKTMCKLKKENLKDKIIAIQGVGSVGAELIRLLTAEGAKVIISDIDEKNLENLNVEKVKPEEIYNVKCDIFSPNACGGVLTKENVKKLKCKMIIGAANNQLASEEVMDIIKKRNIDYVPDYVANIGGLFLSFCELQRLSMDFALEKIKEIIQKRLKKIVRMAEENQETLWVTTEKIITKEIIKQQ